MAKAEKIILGSGKIFVTEFTGTIPEDTAIETDENKLGAVQGGASIEYKPTYYTAKDDLNTIQKTVVTEEEATLKSGICTICAEALEKLCATARITTTETQKQVKIGGIGQDNGKKYLIRFLHEDKADGNVRVTIVGKNEAGFSLAFAKDKETVVDAEFKASPSDKEGTLIIYAEDIKGAAAAASSPKSK